VKGNSTSGRISAIGLDGDGEILLRIAGNPSQEFRLETSGNASDWTLMVAGTTDQQGEAEFRDPNVTEHCKFYRIVSP
jgi:hypothetical protein